jgi:hypothetical protein
MLRTWIRRGTACRILPRNLRSAAYKTVDDKLSKLGSPAATSLTWSRSPVDVQMEMALVGKHRLLNDM